MVCESWWAPDGIGSHGLWKEKWGEVPSFIKEHKCANFSQNLLSMEDSKNPIASHWQEQPPLKAILSLIYKWKALAHAKSLLPSTKGLSFTFMLSLHLLPLCTI
jgi:hypothetical protein